MGYVPIFLRLRGLKSSLNSSRLKNRRAGVNGPSRISSILYGSDIRVLVTY